MADTFDVVELVQSVAGPLATDQPWVGWLVVALCRLRARQDWANGVRETRLSALDEDEGDVPDLPGWRFDVHDTGLCLEGPDQECIDVDDVGRSTGHPIEIGAAAVRIGRMGRHAPGHHVPEGRVRALLPSRHWVAHALRALARVDVVHIGPAGRVRLTDAVEKATSDVAALAFDRDTAARLRDAWGDDEAGLARVQTWSTRAVLAHRDGALLRAHRLTTEHLFSIGAAWADGPLDPALRACIHAMYETVAPPPPWLPRLLDRLEPTEHHPSLAHATTRYLLAHGVERSRCLDTIESFAAIDVVRGFKGNPTRDHLALLMLRYHVGRAEPLLRRAVAERTPVVYRRMGAFLALWPDPHASRWLLDAALSAAPAQRRYLLACLAQRDDDEAQALARAHMPPPPERSGAVGFTHEEVAYAGLRASVERELARARETLASLRPS